MLNGTTKPYAAGSARLGLVFNLHVPVHARYMLAWGSRAQKLAVPISIHCLEAEAHAPLIRDIGDLRVDFIAMVDVSPVDLAVLPGVLSCAHAHLRRGGVVAGVVPYGLGLRNWTSLTWTLGHWRALLLGQGPITVRGLRRQLVDAGFTQMEFAFLEPSLDDPQLLTPVSHFQGGHRVWPESASLKVLCRYLLVTVGLGAFLQRNLFFKASTP